MIILNKIYITTNCKLIEKIYSPPILLQDQWVYIILILSVVSYSLLYHFKLRYFMEIMCLVEVSTIFKCYGMWLNFNLNWMLEMSVNLLNCVTHFLINEKNYQKIFFIWNTPQSQSNSNHKWAYQFDSVSIVKF